MQTEDSYIEEEVDGNKGSRITAHFLAGFIAGIVSRTITAPLDRLKIISQMSGKNVMPIKGIMMMKREGGIWSMWRGNGTNILKVGPEISSKFLAYNEMKNFLMGGDKTKEATTSQRLISGFTAGALSHSIIHPLEVCKTRLALRKTGEEGKLWILARNGYKKNGWRFFFKGYKISILGISLFSCIDFTTYEKLKGSGGGIMLCGICSSLVAILTCFPIGVVGIYLQASDEKIKVSDVKSFILRRGFFGMYSGLPSALVKGLPMFALSYLTYEYVLNCLGHKMV
ncbi:hypothetical protein GE061_002352 [Apolygus lucorum]|uniref:Uncharacterized protein n=1 Tax=Apolygus lucorum TaxID=248454 RepID=A0A6A4IZ65_APOLU|nr:hypothetical protein GE061_002352 [Apolygus lucorum]